MEIKELYQVIGQITYSFGRIDFLISNIAVDLKLAKDYPEFYAKTDFQKKIRDLKEKAFEVIADKLVLEKFDDCMGNLDKLRETILEKVREMYRVRYPYKTDFLY